MNKNEDEMIFIHREALDILETEITFRQSEKIMGEILKDYRIPEELELNLNNDKYIKLLKLHKEVSEFFNGVAKKITVDDDGFTETGVDIFVRCDKNIFIDDAAPFVKLINMSDIFSVTDECGELEFCFGIEKILSLD